MTRHRIAAGVLVAVAAIASSPAAGAFDLQGHRGARGLAPENTLAAFSLALDIGVDTLELDVGVSGDDVLVVAHDRLLNPDLVRDAQGRWLEARGPAVRSLTADALRAFDVGRARPGSATAAAFPMQRPVDGERMPTLDDVFRLAAGRGADRVRFNVESKLSPLAPAESADPDTFARLLVDALRRAGVTSRTTVQSFDWRTLVAVRRLDPAIATACLTSQRRGADTVRADDPAGSPWTAGFVAHALGGAAQAARAAGCATWSPNAADLDVAGVSAARAIGLKVVPWTVDDPGAMRRLIDWGVDGLITDRPDVLREVMAERGMPLPPRHPAPRHSQPR